MRGFIQGSLWGLVLGGAGVGLASLMGEQPNFAAGPSAPQLAAPELDAVGPSPTVAVQPSIDDTPTFAPAAALENVADAEEIAPEVSTAPATLPQTADVAAIIESPETVSAPDIFADVAALAAPRTEAALVEPAPEGNVPQIDTRPAAALPGNDVVAEAPEAETATEEGATPAMAEASEPETVPLEEEESAQVEEAEAGPVVTETAVAPIEEPATPSQEAVSDVATSVTEGDERSEEEVAAVDALPQTTTAVRINRPGAADEEPEADANESPAEDVIPDDAPALLRHAASFEDTGAPAKISIMLIDTGEMPDPVNAVAELGFTPTVTVNALSPASTDLAQAYHAAGVEIAMQAALPEGAQPVDVEVAFEAALGIVPDVAMLFSDGTGAMQDRAATAQVMQILAAEGYGFVTVERGLSNAARTAEQSGVSATTILRDIDGDGEDTRAISRALDQAAFRARQTGEAVLLGRVKPDTLAALRAWAEDLDQDALVIAPVSAILLSDPAN